jgi:hypothetical protein
MTDAHEKLLDWSLKGHLQDCPFPFAPLDTCDCTRLRMQARIDKLEAFIDKAFEAHSNLDLDIDSYHEENN